MISNKYNGNDSFYFSQIANNSLDLCFKFHVQEGISSFSARPNRYRLSFRLGIFVNPKNFRTIWLKRIKNQANIYKIGMGLMGEKWARYRNFAQPQEEWRSPRSVWWTASSLDQLSTNQLIELKQKFNTKHGNIDQYS